jgi:hypothetical protein
MAIIPLKSLLPTGEDVIDADLPRLGGLLLKYLKSCEGVSPIFQLGGFNRGYFVSIMERRNIGLGPLPDNKPEYGARQPEVTQAFLEAWDWLVGDGLLSRNHQQPAEWYLITRKGMALLQQMAREERWEKLGVEAVEHDLRSGEFRLVGGTPQNRDEARAWVKKQEGQAQVKRAGESPARKWDVFISHASEDKAYVYPLVAALEAAGVSVWYDDHTLMWGDDLRPKINDGLINCRYGIVVLSKTFLNIKKWTEYELNGLFAREQAGFPLVLPIWHGITRDDLLKYSPALADRLAKISENDSYQSIVSSMLEHLGRPEGQKKLSAPATAASKSATKAIIRASYGQLQRFQRRPARQGDEALSPKETELLWTAARDPRGEILHSLTLSGEGMRANGQQFLENADARTGAEWLGALRALEERGFVEALSSDRDFFRVTDTGYKAADDLDGFDRWRVESVILRSHYLNAPSEEHILPCKGVIAIPARYSDDEAADGAVMRSLEEPRSLLVEDIERGTLPGWNPNEIEFVDKFQGQVECFKVEGMLFVPPACLKLPISS